MPITDFSQLPSASGGSAKAKPPGPITDFNQLPAATVAPKDERLSFGAEPGLAIDALPSFQSEAGGMPFLSKKGAREWKKYNTPGLPKPSSAEDLTPEVKRKPNFGEGLVAGSAELVDLIATGLFAMPLAAAREQITRGQRAVEQGLGFGRGKNMSRREIAEEAAADAARINETYGSPVLSTLRNWGVVGSDETPIEQGFSAAMARAGQLGENIEHLSKGQVLKEDVLSLVNLSFGALGVKGVEAVGKARMSRAKAQEAAKWLEAVNLDASLRETARMQQGDKPLQLGLGSNEPMISFPDGSVGTRAEVEGYIRGLPESQQVAARAKLLGFKTEPGAPQPQPFAAPGYVETPTGRVVKPGERAENPAEARQRQLADEANARKKAREHARANARAAFAQEPGLDAETKSARGLDLNEADRMQRLAEGQVEQRAAELKAITDPKLLTAAAVGATGLGLAMTYEPDPGEAAMAIGAGALMLGKGKGLTLDAIRTAAEDTPLRAFRDASSTTLNTLENLPGNRSTFTKQSIVELLKRAEVTKAERDVLQPVLDGVPGETITAKQLMEGVKTRTGDFELKPVESAQYADYGLANIDRVERSTGNWQDWIPEDATPAEAARIEAEGRAAEAAAPVATTTIYRSPIELGRNNHFSDPNYFAHTRSFEEGGIKHVVELQSDLAQKAGKVLTEENRAQFEAEAGSIEADLTQLKSILRDEASLSMKDFRSRLQQLPEHLQTRIGTAINDATGVRRANALEADGVWIKRGLKNVADELAVRHAEISAKLREGSPLAAISPMLKNWHKRLVREELASAAQKGEPTVRFATADTVAKVEGWSDTGEARRIQLQDAQERLASHQAHVATLEAMKRGEAPKDEYYSALKIADPEAYDRVIKHIDGELDYAKESLREAEAQFNRTRTAWGDQTRFSPEHQGIYDRYANDVEKFLKQLGGQPYRDSAGHTWLEVPVEGSKKMPAGPRAQQFGFADPKLLGAIAAIGGGIFLGGQVQKWLADDENRGKAGSAIGAAIAGLGLLAASRHAGVGDAAKSLGRGAEKYLGLVSTRVGMMSQPLLRRLTQHEFGVLKNGHERILAAAPFAEGFRAIKKSPEKEALTAAILTNDPRKILPALGRLGSPALVEAWKQTRAALQATGEELKTVGRLKNLREDYFPRLVIDHEGLLEALGTEPKTLLQRALQKAEDEAKMKTGEGLSPLERSNLINKFLASPQFSGQGKAGFLKKRVVGEVTPELAKYYASPDESILLYMRTATREIERAKFFKDLAVRDPETGKINIEASIGNVVNSELAAGRVKINQVDELQGILRSRFGAGEKGMAAPLQDARNLSNLGLLGNAFSALTQAGDVATAVAANGFLPTLKAISQVVGRDPQRITMRDMGLVNHISEEFTNTRATAHALEKAFKYSGFSLVDQFGKATLLNGTLNKFTAMAKTAAGQEKLRQRYGDYLGAEDLGKLASDLRAGQRTPLVNELLFRELSNFQPISKIEVPQGYLDNPNGRILYMLKTFALKQIDIFRREAIHKMKTPGQRLEGTTNLLRFALALGISGASVEAIKNWLYGKDDSLTAGDVLFNFTKTYGMSQYALDQIAQGKPIQAIGSQILPPYKMWEQIVTADPKALRYTPLVGPALYWHGTEDGQRAMELEAKRKARAAQ